MTDFENQFQGYIKSLEQELPTFLQGENFAEQNVIDAMKYSLLSGGKRIRGVLLMATYALFEGDYSKAVPFAAAVEMVHAYSLIHDDLPCMDDDNMRRGKPACHIKFGEATALLAGDGLLTLAFETLALPQNIQNLGAEKTIAAVRTLAQAAGAIGMVGGQMIDLENEKQNPTLDMLMLIDGKKTGALIKSCCEIGCILGGCNQKITGHLIQYASKIGLAFQIVDDILDVEGNPQELGKPTGSDSGNEKQTYASIYGLPKAKETVEQLTREAIDELKATELDVEFLCALARMLVGRTH